MAPHRRIRIAVVDSWAGDLHTDFVSAFPNVTFSSYQHRSLNGISRHPHGGWVASLICQQVADMPLDIKFFRIFDNKGSGGLSDAAFFDTIGVMQEYKPDYVCCSWGMADGDNDFTEMTQRIFFDEVWINGWIGAYRGADCFWASGNDDKNDADQDVDAPQKFLKDYTLKSSENTHIIGSVQWSGVPSVFSGDGAQVDVMYPGQDTYSIDPISGKWVRWSGTSAAAPSALGDCIARSVVKGKSTKEYWRLAASRATRYVDQTSTHPKAGWGAMTYNFQENILMTGRWPGLASKVKARIKGTKTSW